MRSKSLGNRIDASNVDSDLMAKLADELLLNILRRQSHSPYPCSLVCKRWLRLHGLLKSSIKLQDWRFLESGRMKLRFPNLSDVDLTRACVMMVRSGPTILVTHHGFTMPLAPDVLDCFPLECQMQEQQLSAGAVERGLRALAEGFPGLQRLCLVDVGSQLCCRVDFWKLDQLTPKGANTFEEFPFSPKKGEKKKALDKEKSLKPNLKVDLLKRSANGFIPGNDTKINAIVQPINAHSVTKNGLAIIAKTCKMLQELELHQCTDEALAVISACQNLQIVSLFGSLSDFYLGTFTDVGLTILANRCHRLVKLELAGCEASYHGFKAIGQCCVMLEELTLSTDGFQPGWLMALSSCSCLKTLQLKHCKQIDPDPGPTKHLGTCGALDQLQLVHCNLRSQQELCALLSICRNIRELEIKDCWGLDDEVFSFIAKCRRIKSLSLDGCSLLTANGMEYVIMGWKELQRLRVVFCDNIRDTEISPALAAYFTSLKEFRWRPNTKSVLAMRFAGTGVGQRGGKFFKKM